VVICGFRNPTEDFDATLSGLRYSHQAREKTHSLECSCIWLRRQLNSNQYGCLYMIETNDTSIRVAAISYMQRLLRNSWFEPGVARLAPYGNHWTSLHANISLHPVIFASVDLNSVCTGSPLELIAKIFRGTPLDITDMTNLCPVSVIPGLKVRVTWARRSRSTGI
jgi:hypothetical protein